MCGLCGCDGGNSFVNYLPCVLVALPYMIMHLPDNHHMSQCWHHVQMSS